MICYDTSKIQLKDTGKLAKNYGFCTKSARLHHIAPMSELPVPGMPLSAGSKLAAMLAFIPVVEQEQANPRSEKEQLLFPIGILLGSPANGKTHAYQ